MKKILTLMALAAMTLGIVSCGDDNPITEDHLSFGVRDLISKTVSGNTFFDYTNSKLRFDLNYLADTACLHVLDTKFNQRMPVTVSFSLSGMNVDYSSRDRFTLTGTGYDPMESMGYQVNNVRCNVNASLNMYYLAYDVVSSNGTSKVYVYPQTILSVLEDDNLFYTDATELFFTFKCGLNNENNYEGNVLMSNVQFSIGERTSPKMTIRIPYDDHVTITGTTTGYVVTGTGITGKYLQGGTEIPFEQSTIDNLEIVVDVVNKQYSISFDCMGGSFEDTGKLYL